MTDTNFVLDDAHMKLSQSVLAVLTDIKHALVLNQPGKLLTAKHVADLLDVGYTTFMQEIACNANFPVPIQVTEGQKGRRWRLSDIHKFVEGGGFAMATKPIGRPRNAT